MFSSLFPLPSHEPAVKSQKKKANTSSVKYEVCDLTFKELAELEPRLLDFLTEAKSYHLVAGPENGPLCFFSVLMDDDLKPDMYGRLSKIMGPNSGRAGPLGTWDAFQTVVREVRKALPKCRPSCRCQQLDSVQ